LGGKKRSFLWGPAGGLGFLPKIARKTPFFGLGEKTPSGRGFKKTPPGVLTRGCCRGVLLRATGGIKGGRCFYKRRKVCSCLTTSLFEGGRKNAVILTWGNHRCVWRGAVPAQCLKRHVDRASE